MEFLRVASGQLAKARATASSARLWRAALLLVALAGCASFGSYIYYQKGVENHSQGDSEQAIRDYTHALNWDPDNWRARSNRAVAYTDRGDYDLAIADLDLLISRDPSQPAFFANRARAQMLKGDTARAIADYSETIRLSPRSARAINDRGLAYARAGHSDRARADFEAALRLRPSMSMPHNNLALLDAAQNDFKAAEAESAEAIDQEPEAAVYLRDRCLIRTMAGNFTAAMADCSRAVEIANETSTHRIMGYLLLRMNRPDQALAAFETAFSLAPYGSEPPFNQARALYGRALAEMALQRKADADRDFTAARRLDPTVTDDASELRRWAGPAQPI